MIDDLDRYEAWYAEKLWRLLPAIYRASDAADTDSKGPLRELVERVGAQAAVLRRSIDRLWEDQSIETCDDWVIDYLGELLATNLVASLDARGRRIDVAKTIYYRRRKGTVPLLEELASDITGGWCARVVEMFRRLSRPRHLLDPAVGRRAAAPDPRADLQRAQGLYGPLSGTPAGGTADLRGALGAEQAHRAFDEYAHTADVRRGRGAAGWHGVPRLGVFLWRLRSFAVVQGTPVQDATCPNQFTFDPTGRDVPLFASGEREYGDAWTAPRPQDVPGPLSAGLLRAAFDDLYGDQPSHAVALRRGPLWGPVPRSELTGDPRLAGKDRKPWIDGERGRIVWPKPQAGETGEAAEPPVPFRVDYHCGFPSELGAGTYDRYVGTNAPEEPAGAHHVAEAEPLALEPAGVWVIDDSLTYPRVEDVSAIVDLRLQARNQHRPVIRPAPAAAEWKLVGGGDGATLVLDGLWLSGGVDVVLDGSFGTVQLTCCTLDPGTSRPEATKHEWLPAADGRALAPTRLVLRGKVRELLIDRCIIGPIVAEPGSAVERVAISESIVQAADPGVEALSLHDSAVSLSRVTLLGGGAIHRLEASECILHDVLGVEDLQHGCVRFCAFAEGSALPRQYESVPRAPHAGLFASTAFGHPAYAQLLDRAGEELRGGAADGSEMGAFWRERTLVKERSLLIKYQEYMPLGLEPVVVHVT